MLSYARTVRGLGRDVRFYFVVVFLLGVSVFGGISTLLLNLYVLRLGYGPEVVGAVNSAAQITLAVFALPAASLGRRFGSRSMILLGLALLALGYGGMPIAELLVEPFRLGWLLLTPAVYSIGLGLLLVNQAPFLMGVTSAENRNHAYSTQGALWPLAGFLGGLIGGVSPALVAGSLGVGLDQPGPYRYPLLFSAGLVAIAFIVMTRTRGPTDESVAASVGGSGRPPIGVIWMMSLVVFAQVAAEVAVRTFFNVFFDRELLVATSAIGTLSALAQLAGAAASLAMPFLAFRWGRHKTFVLASLAMIASVIPLIFAVSPLPAALGYVGVVAFASIGRTCLIVYQLELVLPQWRGTMIAGTTVTFALSSALVSLLGGYLIGGVGYGALFLAGGVMSLVGTGIFWAYFRTPRGEYAEREQAVA